MTGFFIKVVNKLIAILTNINKKLIDKAPPTSDYIQNKRVLPWFRDNGDKTLRLNYDLSPSSIVFDVGGYEGQWASDIYAMYNCSVLVFEPYLPFAEGIEEKFKKNSKIKLYKFGLGAKSEVVGFSMLDNSSSMVRNAPQKDQIQIVSIVEFIKTNSIDKVDLIKINIEGAEYELLESLIENKMLHLFSNFQIQFHDFIFPNGVERMKAIQKKLSETHVLTYQYEFVWENWKLK